MHTLTLNIKNEAVWNKLLSFINKLPESDVEICNQSKEVPENKWDAMRKALPLLAEFDFERSQPSIQNRELF